MTNNDLVDRLVAFLVTALAELQLEGSDGSRHVAPIVAGWLGPKRAGGEDDRPVVIVRLSTGETGEDGSRTKVRILFGAYSESTAGWRDLGTMLQRTEIALAAARTLGPFHLELPLSWTIYDEQPLPQWQAEMTTTWTHPGAVWTGPTE